MTVTGQSKDPTLPGVLGNPLKFDAPVSDAIGVLGDGGAGFHLVIPPGIPVPGRRGIGVMGTSADPLGAGVLGKNTAGGPAGHFEGDLQVVGNASVTGTVDVSGTVDAHSTSPVKPGIRGTPLKFDAPGPDAIGVLGEGGAGFHLVIPPGIPVPGRRGIGVMGTSADAFGAGVLGGNTAGGTAGQFDGNLEVNGNASVSGDVVVKGDISLANGDCAEDFEIADGCSAEPGTVMVLHDERSLRESAHAYDKRVAGVIAGAGSYKPGIVLDRQHGQRNRKPVALLGKVFCKADAQFGSIGVGDLLTTSPTPGHAMRADDPLKAFGAVIGKALRPLAEGHGLIPILIALQ